MPGWFLIMVEMNVKLIFRMQPTASGFMTAMELGHQRKRVVKISTGSKQFDAILGGCVHTNMA
jgi:meiotic recombination protein DMC1